MTLEQKAWIDGASYEDLLSHWRLAPAGDPIFQDEAGDYYQRVLAEKRAQVGDAEHTRISKAIGWERT